MKHEKLYTERQSVISELTDIAQKLESRPNSGDTVEKAYELAVQVLKGKHDQIIIDLIAEPVAVKVVKLWDVA